MRRREKRHEARGNAFLAKGWAEWLCVLSIRPGVSLLSVHRGHFLVISLRDGQEQSRYLARERLYAGNQDRKTEREGRRNRELRVFPVSPSASSALHNHQDVTLQRGILRQEGNFLLLFVFRLHRFCTASRVSLLFESGSAMLRTVAQTLA